MDKDDGACLYYKFTNEPKGSGELKNRCGWEAFYFSFNFLIGPKCLWAKMGCVRNIQLLEVGKNMAAPSLKRQQLTFQSQTT